MRLKGISPSMVVAIIALIAATAGTAFAAGASIVNIADPSTPANIAKVDSTGALKTSATGTVTSRPSTPATPFDFVTTVPNYYGNGNVYVVVQKPTTATVALSRIALTNSVANANDRETYLYYETVPSGGSCAAFGAGHREFAKENVRAGDTLIDTFPTPIVFKPATAGQQWCLMAGSGPTAAPSPGSDTGDMSVGLSGFVVSGNLTPGPGAAAAPGSRQPARLGG